MESGQAERRIVVPYNSLGGVTLPELCVGIVGRYSHLDISLSILENRPTEIHNHLKWIKSGLIC